MTTLEQWGVILEKYEGNFDPRYGLPDLKAMLLDWQEDHNKLQSELNWYKGLSQTDRSRAKLYLELLEDLRNAFPTP